MRLGKIGVMMGQNKEITFPIIMKLKVNSLIVEFSSDTRGIVKVGNGIWSTGNLFTPSPQEKTFNFNEWEPFKGFLKDDNNKIRLELLDFRFVEGIGEILTMGAKKYEANNWQKAEDASRYEGALLRHLAAYMKGEKVDPESGLPHVYHMGCNLMFLDYFDRKETNDN